MYLDFTFIKLAFDFVNSRFYQDLIELDSTGKYKIDFFLQYDKKNNINKKVNHDFEINFSFKQEFRNLKNCVCLSFTVLGESSLNRVVKQKMQ